MNGSARAAAAASFAACVWLLAACPDAVPDAPAGGGAGPSASASSSTSRGGGASGGGGAASSSSSAGGGASGGASAGGAGGGCDASACPQPVASKCLVAVCAAPASGGPATCTSTQAVDGTACADGLACCGGTCTDQACLLASGQGVPYGIATGNGRVYWTDNRAPNGGVYECPLAAPCQANITQISSVGTNRDAIALSGATVFWSDATTGDVRSSAGAMAGVGGLAQGLAVDGNIFYWSTFGMAGGVFQCAVGGLPTTVADQQVDALGVAVDATDVYWASSVGVQRCAIGDCGDMPELVAADSAGAAGIALHGGTVYWANTLTGAVNACSVTDCMGTLVTVPGPAGPNAVVADDSFFYWVNTLTGVVAYASLAAPSPNVIGTTPGAYAIAQDASHIYWTAVDPNDDSAGSIWMAPKPAP